MTLTKKQGILCSISTQFHMSCGSSWGPPTYCMRDELYAPSSCGVGTTSILQCGLNNERSPEVVTRTRPLSWSAGLTLRIGRASAFRTA